MPSVRVRFILRWYSFFLLDCGLVMSGPDQGCLQGWFGIQCRYKCRCTGERCDTRGDCAEGSRCLPGWFGPQCQYQNSVDKFHNPTWLIDENLTTCNQDPANPVFVTASTPFVFNWIWLQLSGTVDGHIAKGINILILGIDTVACANHSYFLAGMNTVEVHCAAVPKVQKLILWGASIGRLCGINISGGRNVALRQKTKQTSEMSNMSNPSDRAVDGLYSDSLDGCTKARKRGAEWFLIFEKPQRITEFIIRNYSVCPPDRYGRDCENICRCGQDGCHAGTGACRSSCPAGKQFLDCIQACTLGWYGPSCMNRCPDHCQHCDRVTGRCHGECQPGFMPPDCQACDFHHYGDRCQFPCPDTCSVQSCNATTGACDFGCTDGYYGDRCNQLCPGQCRNNSCDQDTGRCTVSCSDSRCEPECQGGFHGDHCEFECSLQCITRLCHGDNGECSQKCPDGYHGEFCQNECSTGTYGVACLEKCPATCAENTCHPETGECDSCIDGYYGRFCQIEEQPTWLFTFFAVLAPIVGLLLCLMKRRTARDVAEGDGELP